MENAKQMNSFQKYNYYCKKIRRKTRKKTLQMRNANKSEEQNLEKTLKTYQEHFFHALQGTPLLGHL